MAAGLVAGLALAALPATGASLRHVAVEELAARADACLVGRIVDETVAWNGDRTLIVTTWDVEITEVLSGSLEQPVVRVHRVGGRLDGLVLAYEGMPVADVGDEVVAFLRGGADGHVVVGLKQGLLQVRAGLVHRDLTGVAGAPAGEASLPLEDVAARVRAATRSEP